MACNHDEVLVSKQPDRVTDHVITLQEKLLKSPQPDRQQRSFRNLGNTADRASVCLWITFYLLILYSADLTRMSKKTVKLVKNGGRTISSCYLPF